MRRFLCAALLLISPAALADTRTNTSLSRALADTLYCRVANNCTVQNFTITGTCIGCSTGAVPTTRLISTTSPLGGGGDLSADRTFTCTTCATSSNNLSFFSATSSAQLAALLNDETGFSAGALAVFSKSPAIETPTIASFVNAPHNHQNAAGGGTLVDAAIVFTAPSLGAPTATTIQTSGNVGVGTTPSGTSGILIDALQAGNLTTRIQARNTDAASAGAIANLRAVGSTAITQISAFGAGVTGTLGGLNLANASSVNNGGFGSGMTVGTANTTSLVLMTNSAAAVTIDSSQNITLAGSLAPNQTSGIVGTTTNNNASAGSVGEFTNAQCPGPTTTATITVTIASPGVVTWTAHPFNGTAPRFDACPVVFTSGGALPTGITTGTTYWIIPSTIGGNTFSIATSVANAIAGTAVNTSGTQSGTHTGTAGSALTTATAKDVTGLALTAGDWDCSALLARGLGGTTSVTLLKTSISTTSATDGTIPAGTMNQYAQAASVPANDVDESIGPLRLLNSGTTNTFLVADDTFTLSTNKAYGTIRCRRMR